MSESAEVNDSKRYSIDIDENFHQWIQEQRRNKETANKSPELVRSGTDDSFETLEKMCNKSVSDVNSTLYKYLHAEDQQQILANVKRRDQQVDDTNTECK